MNCSTPRRVPTGSIASTLVLGLVTVATVGFAAKLAFINLSNPLEGFFEERPEVELLTAPVIAGAFEHRVLERGEIESSSNVEVRCRVKGRSSSSAINILEIVREGTWVEKGDFLVRLDDAALQTQLIQQQIVCGNSESAVIEAKASLASARLALDEYAEGTFIELMEQQQSEVFVAEENKRRAEEYLRYSERLAERGYIPDAQLDADRFALEKAKKELGVANTKLDVLSKYTKEKMLTQLRANIDTAEAKLKSKQKTWELDKHQLQLITDQIELCTITAPVAGQVVYENNRGRSSSAVLIEEGMPVRERQTIINLPDPEKMRVVAKVHESRIGHIQPGQLTQLHLDSMPEVPLTGRVTEVSEYPLPPVSVYMAHVKEYAVSIEIDQPPRDLRPGMTAEVNILVQESENELQVPIESVIEREDQFFCGVLNAEEKVETRAIQVGAVNDTNLVVQSGLSEGEQVILNVNEDGVLDLLDLPEDEG